MFIVDNKNTKSDMGRIGWVDAAKGVAMLMVITVHVVQKISHVPAIMRSISTFGAMGVQIFFVLCAYCLCMSWRDSAIKSYVSAMYLWRKYRRLAPWYLVGIVLYAAMAWICGGTGSLGAYVPMNVVANVLLVNGFFPEAQNGIVPGGWSISCIALFVFAAPLFMKKLSTRTAVWMVVIGVVFVILTMIGHYFYGWSRIYSYCSPLNQLIVFALGVAYWTLRPRLQNACSVFVNVAISMALLLLCIVSVLFDRANAIFYRHVLFALAFIAVLPVLESLRVRYPSWLLWIGRHSYEIFILHFAMIGIVRRLVI